MRARMRKQHAAAAAAFILLSILMTWPLARVLGRGVAYPGDPYINIWIFDWDWWATFHRPLSLFDANAFHPARYSLAFSENLYGLAIVLMPLRAIGVGAITAYNVAMIAGFAFCGFAAYLLGLRLTGSPAAGIAAGVFYAFVPFRFNHLTHVQHVWGGWVPMLLLALLWYVDRPSWRTGAIFGAVFLMNALTNIHWMLFGSFAVAAAAALFALAGVRRWTEPIVATGAASILLIPFLYPYAKVASLYGMTRQWGETKQFSAEWSDWLVSSVLTKVYPRLIDVSVDPERWLFPGLLAVFLAIVALPFIRRFPRPVVLGLLFVAIGVLGSLGLNHPFHTFLYEAVPGFQAVRAPARWAAIAYLGLSMMLAVPTALIGRRREWVALIVPLLLVLETRVAPIRWYMAVPEAPDVYRWLAKQPGRGAVVELPIDVAGSEYLYLLRATEHHKPLVNGVSGFTPPVTARLTAMSKSDPIPDDFVDELRRIGVEHVIVHVDTLSEYETTARAWLRREIGRGRIGFVGRFNAGVAGDFVFSLRGGKRRDPVLEAFLDARRTYNSDTFGAMDPPQKLYRGRAFFSGFAMSPHGIRGVDLLFENGAVRVPAILQADEYVSATFPVYPQTPRPRFASSLLRRPEGVSADTDVQVEITDGRGKKTRLPDYWIRWE
jgi:hypothetical protein